MWFIVLPWIICALGFDHYMGMVKNQLKLLVLITIIIATMEFVMTSSQSEVVATAGKLYGALEINGLACSIVFKCVGGISRDSPSPRSPHIYFLIDINFSIP